MICSVMNWSPPILICFFDQILLFLKVVFEMHDQLRRKEIPLLQHVKPSFRWGLHETLMCCFPIRQAPYQKTKTQQPCRVAFCRNYLQNMDNQGLLSSVFPPHRRFCDTLTRGVLYSSHYLS
ncbi:hypothetical protein CUMW_066300, partial [Citrus unshiu]